MGIWLSEPTGLNELVIEPERSDAPSFHDKVSEARKMVLQSLSASSIPTSPNDIKLEDSMSLTNILFQYA